MSQCLRCSKPCDTTSVFCEACRTQIRDQLQQEEQLGMVVSSSDHGDPLYVSDEGNPEATAQRIPVEERVNGPYPFFALPRMPEPIGAGTSANVLEQAIQKLNLAAQRIAEGDQGGRRMRRAARLTPLRDISSEIQRESTPLHSVSRSQVPGSEPTEQAGPVGLVGPVRQAKQDEQVEDLGQRLPDLWPWLHDSESEESEGGRAIWENQTDPLLSRHFPSSAEAALIEAEDIERAIASGMVPPSSLPKPHRARRPRSKRIRVIFISLALLALLALLTDGALLFVTVTHPKHTTVDVPSGFPTLTLSSSVATIGENVPIQIRHFSASTQVYLTHDIQEAVQTTSGSAMLKVDATGAADTSLIIDSSWGAGFHTVEAEDRVTHYTASATLHINGSGPTRPSHLLVDSNALDMGAATQGTNTIRSLILHNSGNGSISWSASSNQPWLILSPSGGTFSDHALITVGVERGSLKPNDYTGTITISSNVSASIAIQVRMTVRLLPVNVGPVLQVTPVALSFLAIDGGANPSSQILTINNPGNQPLSWSVANNTPPEAVYQSTFLSALGLSSRAGWLSTDQTSGVVAPGTSSTIQVFVQSQILLPGAYTNTLLFTGANGTFNSPQTVGISLTIQPRCSLRLSTGSLTFTAVAGQTNPSSQTLNLSAAGGCGNVANWQASSSVSWLNISPASGQLKGTTASVTTVGVNASSLPPAASPYSGMISFVTGQNTQTVAVQLTLQNPPPPSQPILGVTPLTLNFSATQGQTQQQTQSVTITNSGGGVLNWRTSITALTQNWISVSPTGGAVPAGQLEQMIVTIDSSQLTPATYSAQITLTGTNASGTPASGSPQIVTVNLTVSPPCVFSPPSSSALTFTAVQGASKPPAQQIAIMVSGNCGGPLSWQAKATGTIPSLALTPSNGSLQSGGLATNISVGPAITGLAPGTYSSIVSITATGVSGVAVLGSPQTFTVTLTVQQPCTLQVSATSLTFNALQGQPAPASQSLTISEVGTCARPVSWSVTGAAGSNTWLTLSPTSGADNGSVLVGVNPTSLLAGSYSGTLTISAIGSGGTAVQGSPIVVAISLAVTLPNFSVSGQVLACSDSTCATPVPLAGATVTLLNGTTTVAAVTADSSGKFSFATVPLGTSYTLSVTGTDGTGKTYTGTLTLSVTAPLTNVVVQAF